jgi:cell division protein FtsN
MATSVRRRAGNGPSTGQWMMLGGGAVVVLVLTFALGLLVGRQWARPSASAASPSSSEAARRAATPPARRSGIAAETMADRGPESTEKLTFYQTLTEPLAAQGAPPKPEPKTVAIKTPPPAPTAPPAQSKPAPAASAPAAGPPWTIQVAAFKNRKQADDLRHQLAASGLEAYVANIAGPDGHARFRVRVGTFRSREEAAAAADRLRGSRSLSTFVTLK